LWGRRFYERKEIKDALAYLKLLINPNDDVSLRRVINVPARGIGKGVMDSIEKILQTKRRLCSRPGALRFRPRARSGRN
jgi:DNA helicase-2/ATP-dependent DNA helicase PcrA